MTALQNLLADFRKSAQTEREKGTYFEELIVCYLKNEATYRDLYSDVWTYADWADSQGIDKRDTGIDLVAKTRGTDEFHAIQCKFYADDYKVQKSDIDSFFTASGKKPFKHRVIVATTNNWSEHAEDALQDQQPPVSKIDLFDLETSQIDWSKYAPKKAPILKTKKSLREHQQRAMDGVRIGLKDADRGKLIMACGTGKTFTSLKVAEEVAGAGKRVLFLVPSLSLLSQTLTEWTQESDVPLHSFAVCSDSDVGHKRKKDDDEVQTFTHELRYPATTDAKRLAEEMEKRHDKQHMSVVFSTYHSIDVISKAQKKYGLDEFDLIICDEAHRTTGATFGDDDESNFVKVHNQDFLKGKKRIYMTATPRIYGEVAKASAQKDDVALCSMDDEKLYGKELFVITFSEAVQRSLLVDYKVIVLAVDESHVNARLQKLLKDENNQLRVDDAAKIIGCWKALAKHGTQESLPDDADPMRKAVAFCQVIEVQKGAKTHKVSSKNIAGMFQQVVEAYQEEEEFETTKRLICEAEHIDGSMNASQKEEKLSWLKAETPEDTCRILSNVRCLSEGVDVPALDAVLFLTPRNSQVDVVQSVGRVMRKADGKNRGYVILPVVIPAGVEPHEALNDNKTYAVVWQVLQALRSHDDRFDAMINRLDLNGAEPAKMEVISVSNNVQRKPKTVKGKSNQTAGRGSSTIGRATQNTPPVEQGSLQFEIGEIERAIYAKVVQKCGNRSHWEDWANDIAKIAQTHISRITTILDNPENKKERKAFDAFAEELRDDLNDTITDGEIIEMLAQHLITKPVFDALFSKYSFAQNNPMSLAMQGVLDVLQEHRLDKEADTLQKFYDSVKMRADGVDTAEGKQKIVVELYDKFFRNAFPKMTERLGIVYTPVEVVDFIIHSVNHILKTEFNQSLGSKNVHILDPFTGTGTFITRLLQSGLITKEELPYKYKNEIHANEIVLLAYYIAAINIEAVYHSLVGGDYVPFEGICLTDTFQLHEKDDLVCALLVDNSARRNRQKKLDIKVIVGNPPYSAGQKNDNDDSANVKYENLDKSLQKTYVAASTGNPRSLYDSYIRAFRWASDRIGQAGVIGFVSNAGFLEGKAADGMRKCLADEFSNIYVFHLRGNARTSGELRRKEKDNVFGMGTRTPIAITLLVKNPEAKEHGKIFWHDIGDYLTREEKLEKVASFYDIQGIADANQWQKIEPDEHNDWVNQRDGSFDKFYVLGDKKNPKAPQIFKAYSSGVKTNRDAWVYNYSKVELGRSMRRMVEFYDECIENPNRDDLNDTKKISWSWVLRERFKKGRQQPFNKERMKVALFRPFTKSWLYYDGFYNENRYLVPRIFPDAESDNLVILTNSKYTGNGNIAFIANVIPDLHSNGDAHCFPLYLYDDEVDVDNGSDEQPALFSSSKSHNGLKRVDGMTDEGLAHFESAYPGKGITRSEVFFYIYGLLHSPDYLVRYSDNLTKEIPRIPCVKSYEDFIAFAEAGANLADLHLNYEKAKIYPAKVRGANTDKDYRVVKMAFAKKGKEKDLTTLYYNDQISVSDIPLEAYEYVVNGKPALDWVVERQGVKEDKDSGIVNDANDWAIETMDNPKYPLELFLRVITVSLETMKIVKALPKLQI